MSSSRCSVLPDLFRAPEKSDNPQENNGAATSSTVQSSSGHGVPVVPAPVSSARIVACLSYRMVFAVGCTVAIYLYDTESFKRPIGRISGLRLAEHTDVSWAPDGRSLLVSSYRWLC